jgi:hypothetical protein
MVVMNAKKGIIVILTILIAIGISYDAFTVTVKESSGLLREELRPGAVNLLPVTTDFRNYFVLQSLENSTTVLIGDFSGAEKVISLSTDMNQDGSLDKVEEYYPDTKKPSSPSKPSTPFFSTFEQIKNDIINGAIFDANYSYKMLSINTLKQRIKGGKDVLSWRYGYNVKVYDPDNPSTMMGEFYFSRKDGLYTLIFATYYYKLYKTKIVPPLYYSVYCRDSKDPRIKAVVDELYELMQGKK